MNNFGYILIAIVGIFAAIGSWVFGIGFIATLGAFLLKLAGVTALNQVTFGMIVALLLGCISTSVVSIVALVTLKDAVRNKNKKS